MKRSTKWLILSVIILSSFGYFVYVEYQFKHGHMFDEVSVESTKKEMQFLVGQIEAYRIANGKYPESLDQLFKFYKMTPRVDILLSRNRKIEDSYFNYSRTGNSFVLFSSGLDQKPNTNDDLYSNTISPGSLK